MTSFIACPLCKKSGFDVLSGKECELCGTRARIRHHIPSMIGEFGWTTQEAVNTYYNRIAVKEIETEVSRHLGIFQQNNPDASKSQLKARSNILTQIVSRQVLAKYPIKST
jgi:hypothetical protein